MKWIPQRSLLVAALLLITAIYWIALFVATHLPIRIATGNHLGSPDKVQHVVAFAVLAFLVTGVGMMRGIPSNILFLGVMGLISLYGVVDEATQAFVLYRSPSVLDWVADLVGASIGCLVLILGRQLVAYCRLAAC